MSTPRTSKEAKIKSGTYQACRANENEPILSASTPKIPSDELNPTAQKHWYRIIRSLKEMATLALPDTHAIKQLAMAMGDAEDARKVLDNKGWTYETAQGSIRQRPEVQMYENANKRIYQWIRSLGLTPADRSRVSAVAAGEDDSLDFLSKPKVVDFILKD